MVIEMPDTIECARTSDLKRASSALTLSNRVDHFLARWRFNRAGHRVEPGLYALGDPNPDSPVLASANYTLSFDKLRAALDGVDCYILVLDTKGVNVWCAAGKGTFGTDELVNRIRAANLREVVRHRRIILPQLSAPGVAAHEVKSRSGFRVMYGPVRAADIKAYLRTGEATQEMRRVRFTFKDRAVLVPVELVGVFLPMLAAAIFLLLVGGIPAAAATAASVLAGAVLFPILLPWIPTPNFTTKGLVLGATVAFPFGLAQFAGGGPLWQSLIRAVPYLLMMTATTAFLALNFTGSSTFTSRSGVTREIFAYIPALAIMFGGGLAVFLGIGLAKALGGLP